MTISWGDQEGLLRGAAGKQVGVDEHGVCHLPWGFLCPDVRGLVLYLFMDIVGII